MLAPAATPQPTVDKLHSEINAALADPQLHKTLVDRGLDPMPMSIDQFSKFLQGETARYADIIRTAHIHID